MAARRKHRKGAMRTGKCGRNLVLALRKRCASAKDRKQKSKKEDPGESSTPGQGATASQQGTWMHKELQTLF